MNVVGLPGKSPTAEQRGGAPNETTIRELRAALEAAETGHLQAIGLVMLDQFGEVEMKGVFETIGDARDIMSGLQILSHQICADIVDGL